MLSAPFPSQQLQLADQQVKTWRQIDRSAAHHGKRGAKHRTLHHFGSSKVAARSSARGTVGSDRWLSESTAGGKTLIRVDRSRALLRAL